MEMENQTDVQAAQPPQQQNESTDQVADENTNMVAEDEIETYWKPVRENPSDFDSWTYLLQYVEKKVYGLINSCNN